MVKALIALPAGVPTQALDNVFTAIPGITPRLILDGVGAIVEIPQVLVQAAAALPGLAAVAAGTIPDLDQLPIPPAARPWLEAWNTLFDPAYLETLATRAAQWLTVPVPPCPQTVSGFGAPPPPPPNQDMRLIGTVAAGIVTVDGPGAAQMTPTDYLNATLGVIQGFDILYKNAPAEAHLVFVAEPQRVTLPLDPAAVLPPPANPQGISFPEYEQREAMWRDPALQALGLPAGFTGINAYRDRLLTRAWPAGRPQRSIVFLVTKYNTAHFGYAANGRLVLQLTNALAAVGVENVDRIIAHEICHLFNAPDEYGTCVPQQPFGPFGVPNGNCVNAHIPFIPHVACLMAGESDDMCAWSKAHVGWNPLPFPIPPIV